MTKQTNAASTSSTLARFFSQLGNQRLRLLIVVVLAFAHATFYILAPAQSALVVNTIWNEAQNAIHTGAPFTIAWDPLGQQLAVLTVFYLLMWLFYWLSTYLVANVAETFTLQLREQIAAKLMRLPLSFFDRHKSGEVLARVTSDLDRISEALQTGLFQLILDVGYIVGSLIFMFAYSVPLTAIFIFSMVVCLVATGFVAIRTFKAMEHRQETLADLTGLVEESYTGRNVIRAFNRESASEAEVGDKIEANCKAAQTADFLTNCTNPVMRTVSRIALAIIAYLCGAAMLTGSMTVGVAQAFFQYVNLASEPVTQAAFTINMLQGALASAKRTFALLDEPEEVADPVPGLVPASTDGTVAFDSVAFGYDPEHPLMTDVSFTAEPGQKVAIVGPTGAGKTTLVNLLMRFYETDGGSITLDGAPTKEMTRADLRDRFGMVLQDTWLFGGTVAENIAYGSPDATREDIVRAAKAARVDHFVRTMPEGYDTMLDNDGSSLSQGQRQLITIARVILRDPSVIILDEATSSVDTRTEVEIGHAMDRLMHGRTSFVIAHRLSTIRDADKILYMEHGDVVEQGSHDELMAEGGKYAALYNSQFA